jgi:hypothetical protein
MWLMVLVDLNHSTTDADMRDELELMKLALELELELGGALARA